MSNLPIELYYNEVFKYLKPIDLVILSKVNIFYKKILNEEINKKFKKWSNLKRYFNNPEFFTELLSKDCIISGSFLLQFLLNEIYMNSDIDIYLTEESSIFMKEYLLMEGYLFSGKTDFGEYIEIMEKNDNEPFIVENYVKYGLPPLKIQLIVSKNSLKLIKHFDFNIVKNYFDGKKMYINKNLINKTEIITKYEYENLSNLQKRRIKKYKKRGFNFTIVTN
jgi:hypothetical protein